MQELLFGGSRAQPSNTNNNQSKKPNRNSSQVQQSLISQLRAFSVGISPMEELGLKFNAANNADLAQLRLILSKKLTYPSSEIAETHLRANRLGQGDLHKERDAFNPQNLINQNTRFCPCCGFIEQQETIPLTENLKNVDHIGISTYLFFLTIKHIIFLLTAMFFVYSCYALITNKTASNLYRSNASGHDIQNSNLTFQGFLAYSLGSKQVYQTDFGTKTFNIQCWLGVAMISLWALIFVYIKFRERQAQWDVDYESKTASDYSLMFENMPKGMKPQELQKQLRQYQQQMKQHYTSHLISDPIRVAKINQAIPFYLDSSTFDDEEIKQIEKQYKKCRQQLVDLIKEREDSDKFSLSEEERTNLYNKFEQIKGSKNKRYQELADRIIKEKKEQNKYDNTVPAIVTFGSSYNKEFLEKVHDRESYKFIYKLPCFSGVRKFFHFHKPDGQKIFANILPAPEPQDILWTNLGQSSWEELKRKLLTFLVTLVLLCISFFIIYGLSSLQLNVNSKNKQSQSLANTILSTFISLVISATNIIINQILYYLTKYERNPTYIHEQTSLGMKAVFAVLINSILIPIIVNKFLKSNLYGVDGLAHDVFYLAITNSFLSPILKIFDPSYFFYRLMRWYYNRPYSKLPLTQSQLHARSEYLQFSIGYEYIYIVNLFLFVCFFVSLQPIIVVFAIIGMFCMFWAQKFYLFNRCKRPTPGNNSINTAMYQLIFLGPMMYTLGSFCWSNFFSETANFDNTPNVVALIISGVIFLLPYKKVIKCIVDERPEQNLNFQQDRIFLPSEYDRLNPSTSAKASREYLKYVEDYKKLLAKKSPDQVEQVTYQFGRQCGTGHRYHRALIPHARNMFDFHGDSGDVDQVFVRQLFGGTNQNTVNPFIIGNSILPINANSGQGRAQINMTTQNWLTSEEVTYNQQNNQINPVVDIMSNLKFDEGQTVTYQNNQANQRTQTNATGDINLNFGNLIRASVLDNRKSVSKSPQNEIPMNLPLNLFGNMLNPDLVEKKPGWQNWQN